MRAFLLFFCFLSASLFGHEAIFDLGESLGIPKEEMQKMCDFIEKELPHTAKNRFRPIESGLLCTIERDQKTKRVFIHSDVWLSDGFSKRVTKSILYDRHHPEILARCLGPIRDAYELEIARDLQDMPGIVEARALICRKNSIELLLKLYNAKSIRTIYKEKTYTLTFHEKVKIAQDLMQGLSSIHRKGYIHRDLHSANCLINVDVKGDAREVKAAIADFGRTEKMSHCRHIIPAIVLRYRSPEGFEYKKMRPRSYRAADIFSLGCVLYKLFYEREPPWFAAHLPPKRSSKRRLEKLLHKLNGPRRAQLKNAQNNAHERFEALILSMVHEKAKARKSAAVYATRLQSIH